MAVMPGVISTMALPTANSWEKTPRAIASWANSAWAMTASGISHI